MSMSDIVIIGCGIFGISTAYYLTELLGSGHAVTLIDVADRCCFGASGRPTAFLSKGGDITDPDLDALLNYSLALHASLAASFDGANLWQYQDVLAYDADTPSEPPGFTDRRDIRASSEDRPQGFSWLILGSPWSEAKWSDSRQYVSIDPGAFGQFLLQESIALGANVLFNTEVIKTESEGGSSERTVPCRKLIIAAGAWTAKVYASVFPGPKVEVPIYPAQGSYSILLKPLDERDRLPESRNKSIVLHGNSPSLHLMNRVDHKIHAATTPPAIVELPNFAVEMDPKIKDNLHAIECGIKTLISTPCEVVQRNICFNPLTPSGLPVMSKVPLPRTAATEDQDTEVYILGGHGFWGITASLGSGKLTAQLVLDQTPDLRLERFRLNP